jgi:hypothetical protein
MSEMNGFKDASDGAAGKFADSPLGNEVKDKETNADGKTNYDAPIAREIKSNENPESDIEKSIEDYIDDLKKHSEYPETISDKTFEVSDLNIITPEENARMRDEFNDKKDQLKKEWEQINGRPWPKYDHDVYSSNGKLIRKAGSDYDAHHIQPLGMGGKNEARNITPLRAEVHYDKQGVHAQNSPYSKLNQKLGGMAE